MRRLITQAAAHDAAARLHDDHTRPGKWPSRRKCTPALPHVNVNGTRLNSTAAATQIVRRRMNWRVSASTAQFAIERQAPGRAIEREWPRRDLEPRGKPRVLSGVAFDERPGVGGSLSRQLQGQQIVHHVFGDLHVSLLAAASTAAASFRRARWTRIFTVLALIPRMAPISSKPAPLAASNSGSR